MVYNLICPICQTMQSDTSKLCRQCGADLSLLMHLDDLALAYYNEALPLAKTPSMLDEAITKLHLSLSLDPRHVDSYVILGKLHAQREEFEEAIGFWRRAAELASGDSKAREKAEKGIAKAEQLLRRRQEELEVANRRQAASKQAKRRWQRLKTGALAVGAFLLGMVALSLYPRLVPRHPEVLVQRSLQQHPALSDARLRVSAHGKDIMIEGDVTSPLHRDLVVSIAQQAATDSSLDTSRLRVWPVALATHLQRTLTAWPDALSPHLHDGGSPDTIESLSSAHLTVTPVSENRLQVSGTVSSPASKEVVEKFIGGLALGESVDTGGIVVKDEYVKYAIRQGDTPTSIAQRLSGSIRYLEAIRSFAEQNAQALKDPRRLNIGDIIKMPKHLLVPSGWERAKRDGESTTERRKPDR